MAPSDSKVLWAGTGEAWAIRDADVMGDGVYKSTDAGVTWKNMGLAETGRIGRILVHPKDPDVVYVCALGRATGPQQERGVFKTTDGGKSWTRVFFADPDTGCSGLTMDPQDPNVLFVGTWQVVMHTWAMFSGGAGSGLYVTRDGGAKWTRIRHPGLPKSPVGKVDVQIAPTDPKRVYALIQTATQGSLWRSDDGGTAWRVVSWDRTLIGRAGYYIRLGVSTANADELLIASSSLHKSTDGGLTFSNARGCGDCHDIWIDSTNADHYVVTGDGGMGITTSHGRQLKQIELPIGQQYHVAIDNQVPYWVYSNRQDDGTMRGSSHAPEYPTNVPSMVPPAPRFRFGGEGEGGEAPAPAASPAARAASPSPAAPLAAAGGGGGFGGFFGSPFGPSVPWQHGIGGCESGFTFSEPRDPEIVWSSCYGNEVTRYDARARRARSVSPWIHSLDSPPNAVKYRCHWTPPLAPDPFDSSIYYGCQVIFKTSTGGQSWSVISPDLSTNDPTRIVSSGGVVGDNLGQFYGEVVFAIAPSEVQRGLIWAGTNDGQIWYTADGGGNWTNVTKNVAGLPAWGTIRKIQPSHFDASTAYVAVDYHMMDNRDPFIFKTTDLGKTWTRVSGDLPSGHPLSYVLSVAENPNRKGMLFAGTGHGFYYSLDDGSHWTHFKDGLPAAPASWIEVSRNFHDVVVSTYGRGIYVLRDITRLEQADQIPADAEAFLYVPRPGFRMSRTATADFLYSLKAAPPEKEKVKFEILDASGAVIRTIEAAGARAGLNRQNWDGRFDGPRQVALRTLAPDNPHIWDELRFKDQKTRPIVHWGIQGPQRQGPIAVPGKYSVRMTAGGRSSTRGFELVKDPSMKAPDADLVASTATQLRIRDDINATADMVNRIEVIRKQIEDQLKAPAKPDVVKPLQALDRKLMDVELLLLSRTEMHSDDKWYVEPYKVYLNLVWLGGVVGTGAGDIAGGADFRPTDASLQILDGIEKDLEAAKAAFNNVMEKEVPALNAALAGKLPAALSDSLPQ
jgi:photosystem II stability/assembly factor-like uncharacterized protein